MRTLQQEIADLYNLPSPKQVFDDAEGSLCPFLKWLDKTPGIGYPVYDDFVEQMEWLKAFVTYAELQQLAARYLVEQEVDHAPTT